MSLLEPYHDLFGKISDEEIADQTGLPLEEVKAYHAGLVLGSPPTESVPIEPSPTKTSKAKNPKTSKAKGETPSLDEVVVSGQVSPATQPSPETRVTPPTVRVTREEFIRHGPDGLPWHLRFRDVFNGERAAWLWINHRAVVEEYPPRP